MAPELLRHSSRPDLAERFAERLRRAHRPSDRTRAAPRAEARAVAAPAASNASNAKRPAAAQTMSESLASLWGDDVLAEGSSVTCQRGAKRARPSTVTANEDEEEAFGELFDAF
jgi:hypothetical protein